MRKFRFVIAALAGSMFFSPALAEEKPSGNDAQLKKWLKQFPAADTNSDGVLTMTEAMAFRDKVEKARAGKKSVVPPTMANVKYGEHERNVFDLWLPEGAKDSKKPLPLLLFFHGGGFVAGDKSGFNPAPWLETGYGVASANYRFVDGKKVLSPVPMHDSARAVQFIKTKAKEWNLDPEKFVLSGGSAGAIITLWIGYHDDLKKPDSKDPVERESTRVACLVPINGPVNLDPAWIRKQMGGPHHIHGSFALMFAPKDESYEDEETAKRVKASSPWEFATADDPPTFLVYTTPMTEIPLPESATPDVLVHHPHFGVALKEKLDALGVANDFIHGSDPREGNPIPDFISLHLSKKP